MEEWRHPGPLLGAEEAGGGWGSPEAPPPYPGGRTTPFAAPGCTISEVSAGTRIHRPMAVGVWGAQPGRPHPEPAVCSMWDGDINVWHPSGTTCLCPRAAGFWPHNTGMWLGDTEGASHHPPRCQPGGDTMPSPSPVPPVPAQQGCPQPGSASVVPSDRHNLPGHPSPSPKGTPIMEHPQPG